MDSMKQGKKRKHSNLVFRSALSHDAGYLFTHGAHIEHMFDFMKTSAFLPANIIASGFMDFIRQTLLSFLSIFSGLYNF